MHLKSLEIQGFKSFPDKTVLNFDANITAIVGPNGSGKSNISDAIRWVMGEQSTRALRGGKMEDVIFGGTEVRRSQGFAQVSLTLDNEDGHLSMEDNEIMVTRRYYRSGESEYYINRHLVRLKDINELFMDTGLGQDGYSLIGQGKIDEILSVKSTQRREIFEEAAGISRYRHRKEEAERKLERTRENLLRISDKIEELELQVGPLAEQAEKAKRYFACREELRLLEVSLWMHRLEALREQNRSNGEAYEVMSAQMEDVKRETERLYALMEALTQSLQEKDLEMEAARERLGQIEEESAACDNRLSVLRERRRSNGETILRLGEEREAQMGRGEGLEEQLQKRQDTLSNLQDEEVQCQQRAQTLESQIRTYDAQAAALDSAIAALLEQARKESDSVQQMQSLLSALDASAREIGEREEGLSNSLKELERQIAARLQEEGLLQERAVSMEKAQRAQGEAVQKEQAMRTRSAQAAEEAEGKLRALQVEENTLNARVRMLADMEKFYEGYSKSVKTVMTEAERGRLNGVHGPVAGLIQVPAPYTIAIEIALGGAMQNLVVENEQHGKAVIQYLKQHDAGRVTCLPMNTMRPSQLENRQGFSKVPGFLGIASELVGCEGQYQNTVSNLLGRVVVVKDLDSGIAMAKQYGYRFRIVTLDGQVLSPGGAMSGGSVNKKAGILSRAKELETLRDKQSALKKARAETEQAAQEAKTEAGRALARLQQAEEALRQTQSQLLVSTSQMEGHRAQTQALRLQMEGLQREQSQLLEKNAEAGSRALQAQERMQQSEVSSTQLTGQQEALALQREETGRQKEAAEEALRELRMKLAMMETEKRVSTQSLAELQSLRESLSKDYDRQSREIERMEQETGRLLEECAREERLKEGWQEKKTACRAELDGLTREKLRLEGERNQADRLGRDQNDTLLRAQRELAVLEQRNLSGRQEEAQLLDKLWETYEMTHEAALSMKVPIEDRREAERRVSSLKNEMRGLGNVNLGAVEEFERVSERYDYLQEQRQDVEEAAAQLVEIIEELTGEMKTIFKREFVRIEAAFSKTFVELFQGGKASLALEDEEDILNCGIEIRVQPPGKALKHLSLLSGGEKAFVAIALYFAILKIRPTPFCVLDEIEAALDDVNVVRFARYLRGIAEETQFIVITHRRGTMEEADMLYGVTMEQSGISRILHLNLNEAELAIKGAR